MARMLREITRMALRGGDLERGLAQAIGPDADGIELDDANGEVRVRGTVDDFLTRDRVLAALRLRTSSPIRDQLRVNPEWGEEAQAKQTEFGTEAAARAMTCAEFERID
jgi:hypothetical protein